MTIGFPGTVRDAGSQIPKDLPVGFAQLCRQVHKDLPVGFAQPGSKIHKDTPPVSSAERSGSRPITGGI